MVLTIAEAQRNLAAAQDALNDAVEASRQERLADAITRGREIKVAYDLAKVAFGEAESAYNLARAELGNIGDAIDKHAERKPALTDFPAAEDVAQWELELAGLIAKRDAAGLKARELDTVLARVRQEFLNASGALDYAKQSLVNLGNAASVGRSSKNYV